VVAAAGGGGGGCVVVLVVVVGGGGGARAAGRWARCLGFSFFCFMKIALPRAISPLGTRVTRAYDVALGKELSTERKHLSAEPAIPVVCTVTTGNKQWKVYLYAK
jgi:hypothetical protein